MRSDKRKPIRIQRMSAAELDVAIAGLEKRGFKLLARGDTKSTYTEKRYHQGSFIPYKYAGTALHTQYIAVLRKEEQA